VHVVLRVKHFVTRHLHLVNSLPATCILALCHLLYSMPCYLWWVLHAQPFSSVVAALAWSASLLNPYICPWRSVHGCCTPLGACTPWCQKNTFVGLCAWLALDDRNFKLPTVLSLSVMTWHSGSKLKNALTNCKHDISGNKVKLYV